MTSDPNLQKDRSAWLEANPDEIPYILLRDDVAAEEYWQMVESTLAWANFVLSQRMGELKREMMSALGLG